MSIPGSVTVSYRGTCLDPDVELVECSDCHAAVPWDSFQAHIDWHSRILYASAPAHPVLPVTGEQR